jgi:hypothetical protein
VKGAGVARCRGRRRLGYERAKILDWYRLYLTMAAPSSRAATKRVGGIRSYGVRHTAEGRADRVQMAENLAVELENAALVVDQAVVPAAGTEEFPARGGGRVWACWGKGGARSGSSAR